MPTETQVKTHSFYSRGRNERLVRRAQGDPITTPSGVPIQQAPPVRYEFAPAGRLDIAEGQDKLQDGPYDPETGEPGWQDAVEWLTSHPLLNVRFWHEGHEPDRPLPTEADFMEVITGAAADLDPERVQEALDQESASHNRPLLIATAQGALERILRTRAEIEAAQAHAESRDAEREAREIHEAGVPLPEDASLAPVEDDEPAPEPEAPPEPEVRAQSAPAKPRRKRAG
jgi:hypothetical protein